MNHEPFLMTCPVCQTKATLSETETFCMECGWEFLFSGQPFPPLLQTLLQQKIGVQQRFRTRIQTLEAQVQQAKQLQTTTEQALRDQQTTLQNMAQKAAQEQAAVKKLEQELALKPDKAHLLERLKVFLQQQRALQPALPSETYDIICSCDKGEFLMEVSNDVPSKELPRLVLGVSRQGEIPLVSHAESLYPLPTWDKFTRQRDGDSILYRYSAAWPFPETVSLKFGHYQIPAKDSHFFFNIITKKI
jgi:hypothetical protein